MKKNTAKLLSILITVVMLLGVLPLSSFAARTVEHIEITGVTAPVVGEDADFSWTISEGNGYKKDTDLFGDSCCWQQEDLWGYSDVAFASGYGDIYITFEEGYYYAFEAWVIPTFGSNFSDDLTATINGMDAEVWFYDDGSIGIYYRFNNLIGELVDSIDITGITAPVVGEDAEFGWSVPDDANYTKYSDSNSDTCYWIKSEDWFDPWEDTADVTAYESQADENPMTYDKGFYYTFVANIKPDDGVRVDPYCDAFINGKEAIALLNEDGTASVYCSFDTLDIIESIEITGVIAPEMGKPANFSWSIPENANYEKDIDPDGDSCCWIESSYSPDSDDFDWEGVAYESGIGDFYITFLGGKYYSFHPFVKPAKGYKFADDLTVTVNGREANITDNQGYYAYIRCDFDNLADLQLSELKVTPPTNTKYNYKSNVSLSGLKVIAVYSDGSEIDVTDKVEIYDYDTYQTGKRTTTIYFNEEVASFDYTVKYTWWQWIIVIVLGGWFWY